MNADINKDGVLIIKAENATDRQKLLDWIELNHNALCNYAISVNCAYKQLYTPKNTNP